MTSFDICRMVRKTIGEKGVGHTGTLDPNATGLMIILSGRYTKYLPYCVHGPKTYQAEMKMGIKTDTGDIWGNTIDTEDKVMSHEAFVNVLPSFKGAQKQIPPMVSALKKDGKRLYELAREGVEVEREPRDIFVYDIKATGDFCFAASVSEGTYIRTLCEDIAERLGTIGTMSSLCRSAIGQITLSDAQTLEEFMAQPQCHDIKEVLDQNIPFVEMEDISDVINGRRIQLDSDAPLVFITHEDEVMAVYEKCEGNEYKCRRGLR